jgi:hypothetical protein
MRVAIFRTLLDQVAATGDVVVAGPGGLYDVLAVHGDAHDVVLEVARRDQVPVVRRRKRRKPAA